MTCRTCGRPAENGSPAHWLGCREVLLAYMTPLADSAQPDTCEHDGCSEPKKEWSGRGAKPRYCAAGHKKEK